MKYRGLRGIIYFFTIYFIFSNVLLAKDTIIMPEKLGVTFTKGGLKFNNSRNKKPDTIDIGLFDRFDRLKDVAVFHKNSNEIVFYKNVANTYFTPFYSVSQNKPVKAIESFIPDNYAPYLTKYLSLKVTYKDGTINNIDNSQICGLMDSSSISLVPERNIFNDKKLFLFDYSFIEKKRFQTGYWNEYTTVGDFDNDGLIEVLYTFQTSSLANSPATMVVFKVLPNNQYIIDWDTLLPMGGTNKMKDVYDLDRNGKKEAFGVGYRGSGGYYSMMIQCNAPGNYVFYDSSLPEGYNDLVVVDTCQFDSLKRVGIWASYNGITYSHVNCFYVNKIQTFFWIVDVFSMGFFGGDGALDIKAGDIDEDGKDEILLGDERVSGVLVYLDATGDTTNPYQRKIFNLSGPVSAGWNRVKDLDNDGSKEIIGCGGRSWGGSICILKHRGSPGENNFEAVWFDTLNLRDSPNWGIDSNNIDGKYTILYSDVKSSGPHQWLQLSTYTQRGSTLSMYKSSYTEVDSSAMKNPVMYDIDKDGKADILGSMFTGWPGSGNKHYLIIFGQDFVTKIEPVNESVIKQDNLFQNYPNPFNSKTKINFQISNSGNVQIKIYDITGKEIMTLMNDYKQAGYYSTTFNGSNLASGVYFYRIKAGDFIQTKRMILLK
jgi:hypothetical protein